MTKQSTVIHVSFHANGAHFYFGSIASIFDIFTVEDIGVTEGRLRSYNVELGKPYVNKNCIIRRGNFYRKKGNRGAKTNS